ncbi:MAG: ice-binding family protein [Polaromonas sp.]
MTSSSPARSAASAKPWIAVLMLGAIATACGGGGGRDTIFGTDGAGGGAGIVFVPPAGSIAPGAACASAVAGAPVIVATSPTDGNQFATTSTGGTANNGKQVNATFNQQMDQSTLNASSFSLAPKGGAALVPASVTYNTPTMVVTLSTAASLTPNTTYTAVVQGNVKNLAGAALGCASLWTFKTAVTASAGVAPLVLGTVSRFGNFGGSAGMTNSGNQTIITGASGNTADIGTIATGTSAITGFHDSAPSDIYTEVPGVNVGNVTGKIYTCTNSTTGPTSAGPNAASCAIATQARLDAQTAYLALAAMPAGINPGANLAGLTLAPGVYTAPGGTFLISGSDLTLDAKGDANAVWVFQMAQKLVIGDAAIPRNVILAGGAQAKNISWQVGSDAVINPSGGGSVSGTIIAQAGLVFSTAGSVSLLTLNGRALSLGASVTMVNTAVTVPAP